MADSPRDTIILKCTVCGEENYITSKNKRNKPERLELKKYCPRCKASTVHKEKK
jgi:large subunit ribosomal protein L33